MKKTIVIGIIFVFLISFITVTASEIYSNVYTKLIVGPNVGGGWRCNETTPCWCSGEAVEYNIPGGYRFVDSIKQLQYEGTRGGHGYGKIRVELFNRSNEWQYVGDMFTTERNKEHACLESSILEMPNILASKVRLTYIKTSIDDSECIRIRQDGNRGCSTASSIITASSVINCQCSPGEESCDGSNHLTCNDGCYWTDNGQIIGKCGYSFSVNIEADGISDFIAVQRGTNVVLSWTSTNSSFCTASGDWTGTKPTSGSTQIQPNSVRTYTYTLTCQSSSGQTVQDSVQVRVNPTLPVVITRPAVVTY